MKIGITRENFSVENPQSRSQIPGGHVQAGKTVATPFPPNFSSDFLSDDPGFLA
jgi:hypothetical protein